MYDNIDIVIRKHEPGIILHEINDMLNFLHNPNSIFYLINKIREENIFSDEIKINIGSLLFNIYDSQNQEYSSVYYLHKYKQPVELYRFTCDKYKKTIEYLVDNYQDVINGIINDEIKFHNDQSDFHQRLLPTRKRVN